MRFTSPSRRALGVVAASTIGMSTVLLGVAGIASAAPADESGYTAEAVSGTYTMPAGACAARLFVLGGTGDELSGDDDGLAGLVTTTVRTSPGQVFNLSGGDAGGAGVAGEDSTISSGTLSITAQGGSADSTPRGANVVSSNANPGIEPDEYYDDVDDTFGEFEGAGVAAVVPVPCPTAPDGVYGMAGDGEATIRFTPTYEESGDPLNGEQTYEVSIDGNDFVPLTTTEVDEAYTNDETFTLDDLTNGQTYDVAVRTTTAAGASEASETVSVTPYVPLAAPTGVTVTRGVSGVTVSWAPPAAGTGTFPLAGYQVLYNGGQFGGAPGCVTDAAGRSCFQALPAGDEYSVFVVAVDSQGNPGAESAVLPTGLISGPSIPSSVPAQDNGDITGPAGPISKITAGQKITLQGSGFAPNSTVQLLVYSSPVSLGTVVTDSTGSFSVEVTVPANLANGTHHLVATGVDANGNVRNLVISVTVSGGVATLATTGFDAVPVAVGGGLVLLTGAGLLVGARRRSNA